MSIAIVPGSFDPITLGHINVIERTAAIFDEVVVAVMINPDKTYRFSTEQKNQLVQLSCAHLSNVRVISDGGMLIDLFDKLGADAIVKGVRSIKDFRYEQRMAEWNLSHNSKAETLYMPSAKAFSRISSTAVRRRIDEKRSLEGYVAPAAIEKIVEWGEACPDNR